MFPGVKTPGYSQDVPPGQRNAATGFSGKQEYRFIKKPGRTLPLRHRFNGSVPEPSALRRAREKKYR